MCLGRSASPVSPSPFVWTPPPIEEPRLSLNRDALGYERIRERRFGTRRLQIPLVGRSNASSGLGIPSVRNG